MFLKHRNFIALLLIIVSAVCWTFGQRMVESQVGSGITATSVVIAETEASEVIRPHPDIPSTENSEYWTTETLSPTTEPASPDRYGETERADDHAKRMVGLLLSFASVAMAGAAIFVFSPKKPVFGPDGASLLLALVFTAYNASVNAEYILWGSTYTTLTVISRIVAAAAVLVGIRELYGWIRGRFALSWSLIHRIAGRCTRPQLSLLIYAIWVTLTMIGCICFITENLFCCCGYLTSTVFGLVCLWRYGTDLDHFRKQLDHYRQGMPITVSDGAFSNTEAQLLEVQAQHEEAVRTAVTSERFKVELISNVSHDLRTPLTSILGYSELLQKETLSPEGQEQLRRLHQKAGYMNDLVEALFELTKVSSGVTESKKEQIDLIRLLEQTIGLFDDQLVSAGLTVRRSYAANSVPVVTDGARIHQVFANLLGNAIKYALSGTRIYIEVQETESSCRIRIMNTASYEMDFEPDEIMQRFARGDKARSTKGSGLGLAIAQTYTQSVGGTFRVSVDGDQFSAIVQLPKTERNL